MKQANSNTQFKLNVNGVNALNEIYRALQKEGPYLKLSWSDLISELVISMNEQYLQKEISFLKTKFFDKKAYLKQAALNDESTEAVIKRLQEYEATIRNKNISSTKGILMPNKRNLNKDITNVQTV